ncbi:MAG: hypothetical protein ACK56F_16535 [bacterium]
MGKLISFGLNPAIRVVPFVELPPSAPPAAPAGALSSLKRSSV